MFNFHFPDFCYSFLSILFEGIPFLLLGSLLSGVLDVFLPAHILTRCLPKNVGGGIALGALAGFVFPMCECGSVVVIRRFLRKGLPLSSAIAYMFGAPILSPVVAISTLAAFRGNDPWLMTGLRLSLGLLLAAGIAFIVQALPRTIFQPGVIATSPPNARPRFRIGPAPVAAEGPVLPEGSPHFLRVVSVATSDFLEVAFFFVLGAAAAAVFNTAVDQRVVDPLATNASLATVSMMVLAGLLALCSTTDAFVAASFVKFPFAAKLAFLTFGPLFDVKLFFLYALIFRRWFVVALGLGLFAVIALACVRIAALLP